jgi:hypothetical protein
MRGSVKPLRILLALATNAVPLVGVLRFGWSAPTVLVLFWCETVMLGMGNGVRVAVHRRLTHDPGHWTAGGASFLRKSVGSLLAFSFFHALFLGVFLGIANSNQIGDRSWLPDWAAVLHGVEAVALVTVGGLVADLVTIAELPFALLRQRVDGAFGRVLVLHLTIIFGTMATIAFQSPLAPLCVLIALKALADVTAAMDKQFVTVVDRPARPWTGAARNGARDETSADGSVGIPAAMNAANLRASKAAKRRQAREGGR